jgi:hypothetical protein
MLKFAIIPGLCAVASFGQSPATSSDLFLQKQIINLTDNATGITFSLGSAMNTMPGAPYSADAVTQRIQTLADGNRIIQTTTNKVARDNNGRVYREESLPFSGSANAEPPHLVLIEDPVAAVHITLNSKTKTAIKVPFAQMKKADEAAARNGVPALQTTPSFFLSSGGPPSDIQIVTAKAKKDAEEAAVVRTDLGSQTIEGLVAKGTRITHIIPAGALGNEMSIITTSETWYSPDLKLLILSKSTDPRMGETTYRLTNMSRSQPDPTLFEVPGDYTVKEQPADVLVLKRSDK